MYCVKCGVELADSEKACPLCGTEVLLPKNLSRTLSEPPYPPYPGAVTEGVSRSGVMSLLTFLFFLPFALCLIIDTEINGSMVWSGYASGGILLFYILVLLPNWFRRGNPVIFVPIDFAAIGLYLCYVNYDMGGDWFLSFALPTVGAIGLITTAAVALLRYVRGGKPFIFGGMTILFGFWMILMEFLLYITFDRPAMFRWSLYPFAAFFLLGVFFLLVGIIRPLREWMRRKLFF
ncbi:MAG: zinc ribbon domain-containing protein [Clostridia bacterium]|nr:zinc ribbon domain-containing protein [Clostridia bacterium]